MLGPSRELSGGMRSGVTEVWLLGQAGGVSGLSWGGSSRVGLHGSSSSLSMALGMAAIN